MNETLNGSLQENVLTLLCFDDTSAAVITGVVDTNLFDNAIYKRIAERAAKYFSKYRKAPKEHIADVLELELATDNKDAKTYVRTLRDIKALSRSVNREYVMNELNKFVRQQTLRRSIVEAAEFITRGDVDEAERAIAKGFYARQQTRSKGLRLWEGFDDIKESHVDEPIWTGITGLDKAYVCPAPKELFTILAPPNRGKSWCLIQIGKYAALQRKRVLHVTLEMSERKTKARYAQAFFSASRRPLEKLSVPDFEVDENNKFTALKFKKMPPRPNLGDEKAIKKFNADTKKISGKMQIVIKEFPTDSLTIEALDSFLETLAAEDNFIPDLVCLDYADLMKIGAENVRVETGKVYKGLRRIAVERNLSMVTASQTNRIGEDARILTMKHFAEDYSKAGISDIIVSYNQTQQEKVLGLGRLFVTKARDEANGQIIIMSQAYAIGQFCLSSIWAKQKEYWDAVDAAANKK